MSPSSGRSRGATGRAASPGRAHRPTLTRALRGAAPKRFSARARAFAASTSRSRGGAFVTRSSSRCAVMWAISSTARSNDGLVRLRRLRRPAHLADVLERGCADLVLRRGRLEVVERLDVPAHDPRLARSAGRARGRLARTPSPTSPADRHGRPHGMRRASLQDVGVPEADAAVRDLARDEPRRVVPWIPMKPPPGQRRCRRYHHTRGGATVKRVYRRTQGARAGAP